MALLALVNFSESDLCQAPGSIKVSIFMSKIRQWLDSNEFFITWGFWIAFVALFLIHWFYVGYYAVNAPLADEWPVMFSPDRVAKPFTWSWVFEFNNEHQTVPTKLEVWLNYILFDVNLRYQIIFNFSLYGITLWGAFKVFKTSGLPRLIPVSFLIFALADNDFNNFHWAIQSQWHCFFFAFIWGVYFLFRNPIVQTKDLLIASLFFILSSWSFASGVVLSGVGIASFIVHRVLMRVLDQKRIAWKQILLFLILPFVLSTWLWASGYHSPELHPQYVWPWQSRFWSFLSALLSWIFGVEARSDLWSTLGLGFTTLGFVMVIREYVQKRNWQLGMLLAFSFGFLACLASIAMGRGGFGTSMAKVSRYYSIAILLLPLIAYGVRRIPRYGFKLSLLLWLLCLWGHRDNFNYKKTYKDIAVRMTKGLNCTVRDLSQASCEGSIFGGDTSKYWNFAKEKGLSFTKGPFPLPLPE